MMSYAASVPEFFVLRDKQGNAKACIPGIEAVKIVAMDNGIWEDTTITSEAGKHVAVRQIRVTCEEARFTLGVIRPGIWTILLWKGDVLIPM